VDYIIQLASSQEMRVRIVQHSRISRRPGYKIQYGLTSLTAEEDFPKRFWRLYGVNGALKTAYIIAVAGLFKRLGFDNHASARSFFEANPGKALTLIC